MMCFSATVSFGASLVIGSTGIQAYKQAKDPALKPFALIPIFFAVQQFTEGFIWLNLQNPNLNFSNNFLPFITMVFLIFAWIIWPFYIPYACYKMETEDKRKIYLKALLGIGLVVSLILLYILLTYDTAARIEERHIIFDRSGHVPFLNILGSFYFIALIFPLILSSHKKLGIFAFVNVFSFLFTRFMFENYLISVWCFFAAISSVLVLYIIKDIQGEKSHYFSRLHLPNH